MVLRLKTCNCIDLQKNMIVDKSQGQFINHSSFPGDGLTPTVVINDEERGCHQRLVKSDYVT